MANYQLFHDCALDMRWKIVNEVRSAELASASGIIVLF